jgi:hypothetical protein
MRKNARDGPDPNCESSASPAPGHHRSELLTHEKVWSCLVIGIARDRLEASTWKTSTNSD